MLYQISLTDATGTTALPETNVPLTVAILEGAVDVQTLSYDVYTDFITTKRRWEHTWAYMTEADYNILQGYYLKQFSNYEYPKISIADESVSQVVVRMELNPKRIIDKCGTVQNVTATWRETKQNQILTGDYLLLENGDLLSINLDGYLAL